MAGVEEVAVEPRAQGGVELVMDVEVVRGEATYSYPVSLAPGAICMHLLA